MKIKKHQLKKLISEFSNIPDSGEVINYNHNNYFNLSEIKKGLIESTNNILKNNKMLLGKIIENISENDKIAILSFNKLSLQEQISSIVNTNNLQESKDNEKEEIILSRIDSPERELLNIAMGNPQGIKNKKELKTLTDEEIQSLVNSVNWSRNIRSISFITANVGLSLSLFYGPNLLINAINTLVQPLYDHTGIIIPSFTIPDFSEAATVFFIIAFIYSIQQHSAYRLKKQRIEFSTKSDREKKEDEIARGLYLDDEEINTPYQNIKMMLKNIFRFFTQ